MSRFSIAARYFIVLFRLISLEDKKNVNVSYLVAKSIFYKPLKQFQLFHFYVYVTSNNGY